MSSDFEQYKADLVTKQSRLTRKMNDQDIRLTLFLFVLALLTFIGRLSIPGHGLSPAGTYEAFAHIFVGMLIACIFFDKVRWVAVVLLTILTIFEIAMFVIQVGI